MGLILVARSLVHFVFIFLYIHLTDAYLFIPIVSGVDGCVVLYITFRRQPNHCSCSPRSRDTVREPPGNPPGEHSPDSKWPLPEESCAPWVTSAQHRVWDWDFLRLTK